MKKKYGFTIVELLVVIVVIGILAAITIVSYGGVSQRATVASLQSDLANVSKQLKLDQVINGVYPATLALANNGIGITVCAGAVTCHYTVNNNASPPTYTLYMIKNGIRYRITNDSKPVLISQVVATGGSVADVGGFRIHTFTSSSVFNMTSGDEVEVLVVAGGGGGGSSQVSGGGAGGGGAGGLVYSPNHSIAIGSTNVTVGDGGAPGAAGVAASGVNGEDSVFGTITATGGGFGARSGAVGGNGGSGGGGGYNGYAIIKTGGTAVVGQGNTGGATALLSWAGGAGGGGAGSVGGINKSGHGGGDAGLGLSFSISGSPVMYSSGGKGGDNGPAASPANTGKGGDGTYSAGTAYAGGSGVVIVRYPL
jgi:prepilin-type N-terminal cleavage/methylation domain-containing protein